MSTTRSIARRPRRPGDVRHDPDTVNDDELLDDRRLNGQASPAGRPTPDAVVCEQALLLRANTDCPHCGKRTPVFAMMGTPEFETADTASVLIRRIAQLPPALDKAVRDYGRGLWRSDHSERVRGAHWHSHCRQCGKRLGETFVLGPQGPFRPRLYADRRAIRVEAVLGPFVLTGVQAEHRVSLLGWLDWHRARERKRAGP